MNPKTKALHYADKIKDVLIDMAVKDKLPQDMNQLDVKKIQKILLPVFEVLATLKEDAEMGIRGELDESDYAGKNDVAGFEAQIDLINKL